MAEDDIHFMDMKNAYYMGNFQLAINEAQKLSKVNCMNLVSFRIYNTNHHQSLLGFKFRSKHSARFVCVPSIYCSEKIYGCFGRNITQLFASTCSTSFTSRVLFRTLFASQVGVSGVFLIGSFHLIFIIRRDKIIEKLDKRVAEGFDPQADVLLVIVAAMIYLHIGEYEKSLSILHQADNLEW